MILPFARMGRREAAPGSADSLAVMVKFAASDGVHSVRRRKNRVAIEADVRKNEIIHLIRNSKGDVGVWKWVGEEEVSLHR